MSDFRMPGFGLYRGITRKAHGWQITACVLFMLLAVQTERLHKSDKRPPLVINACGLTGEQPQILKPEDLEDPVADRNGARNFMMHMVQWRLGWSSPTVLRDMQSYLAQCYHTQRLKDVAYLEEAVPSSTDATQKVKRKHELVAQNVRNAMVFPQFRDIECKQDENKFWFCMMDVAVVTQGLKEPYATLMPKYWLIKTTLLPVAYTPETPWGLVMADFSMFPRAEVDS